MASLWPCQDGSRWPREEPVENTKRQRPMVSRRFFSTAWILRRPGFRQLKTARETAKIAPAGAQESSNMSKETTKTISREPISS
eukprot:4617481-Pyramimonas_sp.AAC.1